MRKHFLTLLALFLVTQSGWSVDQTYYVSIANTKDKTLRDNLYSIASAGPKNMSYNGLWSAYYTTDVYPADSTGKAGKVWDMYSNVLFTPGSNQCGNYKNVGSCYNREHSLPKSWFNEKAPAYYDLGHIVPTDGYVNNQRSNYPFGECANGTRLSNGSYRAAGRLGTSTFEGYTSAGKVFEPDDQYKGDFARMYMYMVVRYKKGNSDGVVFTATSHGELMFNDIDEHLGLTDYSVALLMKWHRMDPVSRKEIDRNNGMQEKQSNRNPFIDYPLLAEYLWGNRVGQAFSFDDAMGSFEKDFVPGQSDGSRNGGGPVVVPDTKYGVTWLVNGDELRTDSVAENARVSALPDEPVSCSAESPVFVGWTDMPIVGTTDDEPTVLYVKASEIPAITDNVVFYAVFARQETGGTATPQSYVYNTESKDGWSNSAAWTNNYWLLKQGTEVISPEVDLAGLSSIVVKMRTYGSVANKSDVVTISADNTTIATLKATSKTLTDYTWTRPAQSALSGTYALHFTDEASTSAGIGFSSITIDATGAGIETTRYITSCQGTTELETTMTDLPAKKILVGGQMYILIDGHYYTVMGQRIR